MPPPSATTTMPNGALLDEAAFGPVIGMTNALSEPRSPTAMLLVQRAMELVDEAEQLIADHKARIAYLEELSTTDELTGLLNRRGFMAQLRRALAEARRFHECGVLMMCDLDGLKPVNDRLGHLAGDAAIRRTGELLASSIRTTDFVGRIGGDEFAVLLTRCKVSGGHQRVEEICRRVNGGTVTWNDTVLPLSASFGTTIFSGNDDEDQILSRADMDLYAAKREKKMPVLATAPMVSAAG